MDYSEAERMEYTVERTKLLKVGSEEYIKYKTRGWYIVNTHLEIQLEYGGIRLKGTTNLNLNFVEDGLVDRINLLMNTEAVMLIIS